MIVQQIYIAYCFWPSDASLNMQLDIKHYERKRISYNSSALLQRKPYNTGTFKSLKKTCDMRKYKTKNMSSST